MNSNRAAVVLVPFGALLAWFLARMFVQEGIGPILGTIVGAVVVLAIFKANETFLPIVILVTLSLGSSYNWALNERSFYLRFVVLALVAFRALLLFFSKREKPQERPGVTMVHFFFLLVGLYGLIGSMFSVDPSRSAQRSITFLLLFVVIFVYFWIRSDSAERCAGYAVAVWRSTALLLGLGYLFLVLGMPGLFVSGRLRLIVQNPNQLGHYCALMAPIFVWYMFEHPEGFTKQLGRAAMAALAISLFWAGSRGALIAAIASVGLQFALCYRQKLTVLLLTLFFGTAVHVLTRSTTFQVDQDPSFFETRVLRKESIETGSGRTGVWKSAQRVIAKQPWLGHGFAVTDQLFWKGYFPDLPLEFNGGHVHSSFLEELVNLGWVGASPLFLCLVLLWIDGLKIVTGSFVTTPNHRLACAYFCVMMAGTISATFESWFTSVGSVFCFPFWFSGMFVLRMTRWFNDWRKA